ncbi:glycosyltransferase family 4 protein [Asticcacaulis sp. BYS171W]|uniref:Glycosyltransferase family 4 protein n=1 Tax=Asticcacaulis aquaticus TaxID=2984212 RepID=A0ABT5HSB2_9CAUL|nr:glycosyltransferase family 4 protein [Asticcacaulis aquaticus]MDC7682884.1 glycosyltransferase family 4 protein [Asticcacaulis aquaticus]
MQPFVSALLTPIHRTLLKARLKHAAQQWTKAEARVRPDAHTIRVTGFFGEALGLGRAAHLTVGALEGAGYGVVREDLRPLHRRLLTRSPEAFADSASVWIIQANPPEARIALMAHDPAQWSQMYRIAYWAWESDLAPANWLDAAQWFHEIWVLSGFVQNAFVRAFERAGMHNQISKLRVMPPPVPVAEPMRSENTAVTVLTLFDPRSDTERKNPEAVIRAWRMAFPELTSARLRVKTYSGAEGHPGFQTLHNLAQGRRDIIFQCETLSDADTAALIARTNILISLHRGEGFGLPLAEAMAVGIPVVATGWSGNMEFMDEKSAWLIPFHLIPANARYNGSHAQWAEPDIAAAAQALKQLCENAGERQALGARGRAAIASLHNAWTRENLF